MGKVALVLLSLALVPLAIPVASAEEVCMGGLVGSCVAAGADDGVYFCERNVGSACTVGVFAAGERTFEAHEAFEGNHVLLDADGGLFLYHARDGRMLFDELLVAQAGAGGASAQWRQNWVAVDGSGAPSSHLCFVANVDGTLVGLACGDWLNGEVEPVFEDHTGETVDEVRNDPLVQCVLTRRCIL